MQIRRLKINDHKCLVDFEINFVTNDGGSSTILIGENGTGKSTVLESILEILMSFDSDAIEKKISYDYEFEYFYGGSNISIYQRDKTYQINIDGESFCRGKIDTVRKHIARRTVFPKRINYFYSGASNKVLHNINRGNINYGTKCRSAVMQYWRTTVWANHEYRGEFPKRKYNYCADLLTPIYLISILAGQRTFEKQYLQDQCHMTRIESITICLDIERLPQSLQEEVRGGGNEWLYEIIDFVDDRFSELMHRGFLYDYENLFFFELEDIAELELDTISLFNFFEKLVTIFNAEYSVYISVGNSRVNCNDLSEGQRQLIKILGMLGICKSEDTLVLMDEPDAHMNPAWKYSLKSTIDKCLSEAVNTQAIIATHDPLVINGVPKEYIRIFTRNENQGRFFTRVITPVENTEGMGIDGLLQSEYYGLQTSYDQKSHKKFLRRQELYLKLIGESATDEEKAELREITKDLGLLPLSYNSIDFLYDDFLNVYKRCNLYSKEYLTYDQVLERREKIKEIIEALYEGQV